MLLLTVFEPPTSTSSPTIPPPAGTTSAGDYNDPAAAPYSDTDMSGSTFSYSYVHGAELPALRVPWADRDGFDIDFTSGWTFVLAVGQIGSTAIFTKTSGLSGGVGFIDIAWSPAAATDLDRLIPGRYDAQLRAHRTSDNSDRIRLGEIIILTGISE